MKLLAHRRISLTLLVLLMNGRDELHGQADSAVSLINRQLGDKWKEQKLQPAGRTSDAEFIRRVSLDTIGRVPTLDELRAFEKDPAADKRAQLVDQLLASKEYATYWATLWTSWLLPSLNNPINRAQLVLWLEEDLGKNRSYRDLVTELLAGTGKTNENGRVNFILSGLGEELREPIKTGRFTLVPATSRGLRLFLGYRLNYDLPEDSAELDWKPSYFWGVNAFFRQVQLNGPPKWNPLSNQAIVLELLDNPDYNQSGLITYPAADNKTAETPPIFLDGRKIPAGWKGTRRQALAELLTSHPNFANAYVNRMWGEFFGRGLHERPVVDDFGSKHKIVHPELLDGLAKGFIQSGYDSKKLIRAICLSDAYQLKSTSNATNSKPETEVYFSRMPLRVLRPEQLIRSVVTAVQPYGAGARQLQANTPRLQADAPAWDDRPLHDKIIHNVAYLNRRELQELLTAKTSGTLAEAVKAKDSQAALNHIYQAVLGRPATMDESQRIATALVLKKGERPGESALQDVLWALLNSSEFILNH